MIVLRTESPIARKTHICDWCGGVIRKGERYDFQVCVYDGRAYNWKNHKRCMEIAVKLKMFDNGDDGVSDMMFHEEITEAYIDLFYKQGIENHKLPSFAFSFTIYQILYTKY